MGIVVCAGLQRAGVWCKPVSSLTVPPLRVRGNPVGIGPIQPKQVGCCICQRQRLGGTAGKSPVPDLMVRDGSLYF
jgi:hypothetical protein